MEYTVETLMILAVSEIPEEKLEGILTEWQFKDFKIIKEAKLELLKVVVQHWGDSGVCREYNTLGRKGNQEIQDYYKVGLAIVYGLDSAKAMLYEKSFAEREADSMFGEDIIDSMENDDYDETGHFTGGGI